MGIDEFSYLLSYALAIVAVGVVALLVGQCLIMGRIRRHIWQGLIPGYNLYLIFRAAGLRLLFLAYLGVAVLTFVFWSMPQPEVQDLIWIPIVLGVLMVMYVSLALAERLRLGIGWQIVAFLFPSYAWVLMGLTRATLDEDYYPLIVRPFRWLERRIDGTPEEPEASGDEELADEVSGDEELADDGAGEPEEPEEPEVEGPASEAPSTYPGYRLRRVHAAGTLAEGEPEPDPAPDPDSEPEPDPEPEDMPAAPEGSSLGAEGAVAPEAPTTEEPAMGNVIDEPESPNEEPELVGHTFDPMDEVEVALVEEDAEEARVELLEKTDDEPDPTGYQARHLAEVAERFEAEEAAREAAEERAYQGKRFAEAVVDFSDDPEDDLSDTSDHQPKHGA